MFVSQETTEEQNIRLKRDREKTTYKGGEKEKRLVDVKTNQ